MVYSPQRDSSITAAFGPSRNSFRWTDNMIEYSNACVRNAVNSCICSKRIPADFILQGLSIRTATHKITKADGEFPKCNFMLQYIYPKYVYAVVARISRTHVIFKKIHLFSAPFKLHTLTLLSKLGHVFQ